MNTSPSHNTNKSVHDQEECNLGVLCKRLENLKEVARKMYGGLKKDARQADNAQLVFTEEAVNWLRGANITTMAALRAAQAQIERQVE